MFTGIIEETGTIKSIDHHGDYARLTIKASKVLGKNDPYSIPTAIGDSIAVNGICLTVTELGSDSFSADVMHETLNRTAFSTLKTGSPVNLERAMAANGRFGGHIVSGHVDGTGTVKSLKNDGNAVWFEIAIPDSLSPYIVEKGSITIDGISLTVADCGYTPGGAYFKVSIIPHTLAETSLGTKKPGSPVNLETDIIGKYVEHLLSMGIVEGVAKGRYTESQKARDERLMSLLADF